MIENVRNDYGKRLNEELGGSSGIQLQIRVNSRTALAANETALAVMSESASGELTIVCRVPFVELAAVDIERLPGIGRMTAQLRIRRQSADAEQTEVVPLRAWGVRNAEKLVYAGHWIRSRLVGGETAVPYAAPDTSRMLGGLVGISAGSSHSIFVRTDGSMYAAGRAHADDIPPGSGNHFRERFNVPKSGSKPGMLGDGSRFFGKYVPVKAQISEKVIAAAAGLVHSACIAGEGRWLYCYGGGSQGQLGTGNFSGQSVPTAAVDRSGKPFGDVASVSVSTGHYYRAFTVIVRQNRTLFFIGAFEGGSYGAPFVSPWPVQIGEGVLEDVVEACAGEDDILVLRASGEVWICRAVLTGDERFQWVYKPLVTEGGRTLAGIKHISAHARSKAALTETGRVLFWNDPPGGRADPSAITYVQGEYGVGRLDQVSSISCGHGFLLMIRQSTAMAIGENSQGQLSDGSTQYRKFPVRMQTAERNPIDNAVAVSAGRGHSLVMVEINGTNYAFSAGNNEVGTLADCSSTSRTMAVPVLRRTPISILRWNTLFHFLKNVRDINKP